MTTRWSKRALGALAAFGLILPAAFAQPGANANIDVSLGAMSSWTYQGHAGVFPNGSAGFAMSTTSCNLKSAPDGLNVPWLISNGIANAACTTPMERRHPKIGFIAARYTPSDDRLVQISDRSYVKHGFFALSQTICGPCPAASPGTWLALQCADTYGVGNNNDHYYLAPPDEINPWTNVWTPCGSHFDRGEPPVAIAQQTDGARSLSSTQANALNAADAHVVRIADSDLGIAGASYYYGAFYVIESWTQITAANPVPNPAASVGFLQNEPDAARTNNLGTRPFTATWTGSAWSVTNPASVIQYGTVLQRWPGATITSNTNGVDDGRIYVAVKVSGPSATTGLYHYEFAVHNRDNARAVNAFRIPTCPGTQISNVFVHDNDKAGANNWNAAVVGSEIVFSGPAGNEIRWNSFHNFGFDCDAAPAAGTVLLDQAFAGPGAAQVSIATTVPAGLFNENLGPGCGAPVPALFATGTPARATIPNASFGLRTTGNPPLAPVGLLLSFATGTLPLGGGCTLYSSGIPTMIQIAGAFCDGAGTANFAAPIPNDPSLEGQSADVQVFAFAPGGPYLGSFNFTNGLRVRLGSSIGNCP